MEYLMIIQNLHQNPMSAKEVKEIKKSIISSLISKINPTRDYPLFYSVIEFGFYDNNGNRKSDTEIDKFWHRGSVEQTNGLIKNMLKEAFNIKNFWFFLERHKPILDDDGNLKSEGRFHTNIIATGINDDTINKPKRKCRQLINSSCPRAFHCLSLLQQKKLLFDACCHQAKWVNRYRPSIVTQFIPTLTDLKRTTYYCLQDFTHKELSVKKGIGKDFMDVVDFKNSDF